jgi:hypothetical protein
MKTIFTKAAREHLIEALKSGELHEEMTPASAQADIILAPTFVTFVLSDIRAFSIPPKEVLKQVEAAFAKGRFHAQVEGSKIKIQVQGAGYKAPNPRVG